jgi:hypothetical protein
MKRTSIFWGLALVIVGLALLIGNLVGINIWIYIWPLALILLGIWILFGSRLRKLETENIVVPLEGAAAARVRIDHGAGTLTISGGTAPENLAEGSFAGGVNLKRARMGDATEVEFRFPDVDVAMWLPGDTRDWSLRLNPSVPMMVSINAGAGLTRADLSGLNITDLSVKTGASSVELTLPQAPGTTHAKIEGGATSVDIRVPQGVAARIHTESGLSSVNVDTARFPRQDGMYTSPDYATAASKIELVISVGVGSVTIH